MLSNGCSGIASSSVKLRGLEINKPVYLDYEKLAKERTIFVTITGPLGFNLYDIIKAELSNTGMDVVSDPQKAAYVLRVFIKKYNKEEIVADVLIRERPEIITTKPLPERVYTTDIDSNDYLVTISVDVDSYTQEDAFRVLIKQISNFFKVR